VQMSIGDVYWPIISRKGDSNSHNHTPDTDNGSRRHNMHGAYCKLQVDWRAYNCTHRSACHYLQQAESTLGIRDRSGNFFLRTGGSQGRNFWKAMARSAGATLCTGTGTSPQWDLLKGRGGRIATDPDASAYTLCTGTAASRKHPGK
jgi:hypothetical protein